MLESICLKLEYWINEQAFKEAEASTKEDRLMNLSELYRIDGMRQALNQLREIVKECGKTSFVKK